VLNPVRSVLRIITVTGDVRRSLLILGLALGGAWFPACSAPDAGDAPVSAAPAPVATGSGPSGTAPRASRPEVVFLGDSLAAGLGLSRELSFPALIQQRIDAAGLDYTVVNAGVSGDTSAGGLRRLEWALQGEPRVLVVALGGNDGLRGLDPDELKKNLAAIIERAQRTGLSVILAGMEAPPNNGPDYTAQFRQVYPDLARTYKVPLIPFLLDGVAGDPALNQADGIHPNPEGARRVADTVWKVLEPALQAATRPS
jgi:acyl-CoA thioesterase I